MLTTSSPRRPLAERADKDDEQDGVVEEAVKKIDAMMSNCLKLNVPLLVEIGVDKNWGDAH